MYVPFRLSFKKVLTRVLVHFLTSDFVDYFMMRNLMIFAIFGNKRAHRVKDLLTPRAFENLFKIEPVYPNSHIHF